MNALGASSAQKHTIGLSSPDRKIKNPFAELIRW